MLYIFLTILRRVYGIGRFYFPFGCWNYRKILGDVFQSFFFIIFYADDQHSIVGLIIFFIKKAVSIRFHYFDIFKGSYCAIFVILIHVVDCYIEFVMIYCVIIYI